MLGLIIVTLLALASRGDATCKQPADYPTEIPLIGCPTSVSVQNVCLRCLEGQISYRIFYDGNASAVADAWRPALEKSGWKIEQTSITPSGVRAFYASKGNRRLGAAVYLGGTDQWSPFTEKLKGTMVFATFYTMR